MSYISRGEYWNYVNFIVFKDIFEELVEDMDFVTSMLNSTNNDTNRYIKNYTGFYIKLPKNHRYPDTFVERPVRTTKYTGWVFNNMKRLKPNNEFTENSDEHV